MMPGFTELVYQPFPKVNVNKDKQQTIHHFKYFISFNPVILQGPLDCPEEIGYLRIQ